MGNIKTRQIADKGCNMYTVTVSGGTGVVYQGESLWDALKIAGAWNEWAARNDVDIVVDIVVGEE